MEVFGNICENAFKYGDSKVKVSCEESNTALTVIIEDNGPGVSDNAKSRVLERGARADTVNPGQGIGLAVAVDIISAYNGGIEIETSSLGGAKFMIELPL